jgi:hypothetical protein
MITVSRFFFPTWPGLYKSDKINQMIALTVNTLSSAYCNA